MTIKYNEIKKGRFFSRIKTHISTFIFGHIKKVKCDILLYVYTIFSETANGATRFITKLLYLFKK